jgi:hypothetical protein
LVSNDSSGESAKSVVSQFVDYLCLLYHEARNVRHLIKRGYVEAARFQKLQSLPTKKFDAWVKLEPLRAKSSAANSASAAVEVFVQYFGLSIRDLAELFEDPHWKNSSSGGNAWAGITACVDHLKDSIDHHDAVEVDGLLKQLPLMRHNTGMVGDKLRSLSTSPSPRAPGR